MEKICQHCCAIRSACQSVADRSAQPFEDGSLEQKLLDPSRLPVQDLFQEILQNEVLPPRKITDEWTGVRTSL